MSWDREEKEIGALKNDLSFVLSNTENRMCLRKLYIFTYTCQHRNTIRIYESVMNGGRCSGTTYLETVCGDCGSEYYSVFL